MRGHLSCRWSRWAGLAAVVPALVSCTSNPLQPPIDTPDGGPRCLAQQTVGRSVDLLFLIDDSTSMAPLQQNLARNFPRFMQALEAAPGGLPDVHIAVASTDMGVQGEGTPSAIGGCDGEGKAGAFQYSARGPCTATNLQAGATFISNVGGVANYAGSLADTFACMAALGESGCGFEQPFAAMTRALGADGRSAPVPNQGFLRDDAYLGIVLITNEDDCSAVPGSRLFDVDSDVTLTSELGPPSNFRCNEFGHLCDGVPPVRDAPNNSTSDTVTYQSCVSSEQSGRLKTVAETAAQIRSLKSDPANQIAFAAIAAPAAPYTVRWKNPPLSDTGPWPEISHSCTTTDGGFGDPSIRVTELARQFGAHGLVASICDGEFASALQLIGQQMVALIDGGPGTPDDDCR
jgi:hypothetical protein